MSARSSLPTLESYRSSSQASTALAAVRERAKLERAGRLSWIHWLVVAMSLGLTVLAWYTTKRQLEEKQTGRFEREAQHVVELITDRMAKYEDGLRSGTGAIRAFGGDLTHPEWQSFAGTLRLNERYPGINGIGVIHHIPATNLSDYLEQQRRYRPSYHIHPFQRRDVYLPISYIFPEEGNQQAVGLDMAFESNRYAAALRARDAGQPQITAPIVLVQDSQQTAGFLFYLPFYVGTPRSPSERRVSFTGLVYAPFVVDRLMLGVLGKENRLVSIRLRDGEEVLFDELHSAERGFDPQPLFRKQIELNMYGRSWRFDIHSDRAFRTASQNDQPATILIGGLLIDALLLGLFLTLSRANRRALEFADLANQELQQSSEELLRSNADLEQFAHVSSHDLQEPLRMVESYCLLLRADYGTTLDENAQEYIGYAVEGAQRMRSLVSCLLEYSRVNSAPLERESVDCNELMRQVKQDLELAIRDAEATIEVGQLPTTAGNAVLLRQLFQNLIANGLRFRGKDPPKVTIRATTYEDHHRFDVRDNGIGIKPEHTKKIFQMFQRLHHRSEYPGMGVGLAIAQRIVERHEGEIWVTSTPGQGSTFSFTLGTKLDERKPHAERKSPIPQRFNVAADRSA